MLFSRFLGYKHGIHSWKLSDYKWFEWPLGIAESEHWSSFFSFFIFSQNILKEEMAETYKWQWQWKGGEGILSIHIVVMY
jgi:hypothetical protein